MKWDFKDGFWSLGKWRVTEDGRVEYCLSSRPVPVIKTSSVNEGKRFVEKMLWGERLKKTPSVAEAKKLLEE